MDILRAVVRELVGLIVDDVGFAAAAVGWIALVWALATFVLPPTPWLGVLLFGGLGLILVESVFRRAGEVR